MTARDAATEADPTDEVVSDDAATPAAGSGVVGDDTAGAADTVDTDTDTDTDTATDTAATDDAGRRAGRRERRRHRHAAGDTAAATPTPTPTPARRGRGRLVVAALVVAALFAGVMVGLYLVRRPDPVAGLSSSQQAAIDAATQAAVNLQTFRRASFDQDFANALASLTPEFASQQLEPRKDALQQQLTSGGRDASATALSSGLVSSTASQAVVLVVTNTTQTADDGTSTPFVFSRLQLTLQYTGGKWLVSDLTSVGLS